MKHVFLLLLASACLTAAYLSGYSQQPSAEKPPAFTKVGVVDIVQVYEKCARVKSLKDRMKKAIEPYTKKKEEIESLVNDWQVALKKPRLPREERDKGIEIVRECKRKLQDLDLNFTRDVARQFEEETGALAKQIHSSIQAHAARNSYHLVIEYCDPHKLLESSVIMQRLIGALDKGNMVVAYAEPGVDITAEILGILNNPADQANEGDDP